AIALEHNDGAPAGFEHHGLAVANAQTPAARAGGNATSRGVDMNAAAAGRDLNITAHFADLDRPATAGSGDRAADLVEMNASAAGRDIYSAVQALRGDCAALRLQHHRCCLRRRSNIEVDITAVVAFALRAEHGNLAGGSAEPDLVEFAACGLFGTGAHVLTD